MHLNIGRLKTDLSGQIFGRLKVLYVDHDKVGKIRGSYYICDCICGNRISRSRHSLVRATNPAKSCGCLQKESARNSVLPNGGSDKNSWIGKYKRRAKSQNVEFTLINERFFELCSQDCFYCGDAPVPRSHGYKAVNGEVFLANGLDRIEPKKGYTEDNVVTCCTDCNLQKRDTPQSEFIEKAIKIAKIHNRENK